MNKPKQNFCGYNVFSESLNCLPEKSKLLINTINQYSYCIAENDNEFKQALLKSDVLLPDGIAIVVAGRFLNGQKFKKIAGADIHSHYLNELNLKKGRCFYLGASESTLSKIKEKLAIEYPNITVGTYSPPFKKEFSAQDNEDMLKAVNSFNTDVLFVGMTAPKQEKWATEHKNEINAKAICTIGAVFDFYAGTINRPAQLWINLGLEWLVRLVKEPKRMWRRYIYYGPVFIASIFKAKLITKSN